MALIQTTSSDICDSSESGEGRRRKACGVTLEDGTEIRAKAILSNATPKVTYFDLLPKVSQSDIINTTNQ